MSYHIVDPQILAAQAKQAAEAQANMEQSPESQMMRPEQWYGGVSIHESPLKANGLRGDGSYASAKKRISARIDDLTKQRANYLAYQADRVKEHDHHGAWDAAVNLSEVECEIAGLKFALEAMT